MNKIPSLRLELVNNSTISLKVTVPGTNIRKFKNLGYKIDPKHWNQPDQVVKRTHPDAGKINAAILEEKNKLKQTFEIDSSKGVVFTISHIEKRLLFEYYDPTIDFYAFCTEQVGLKNYSSETRRTYNAEITKMQQFAPSLSFADITFSWLQQFENYMRVKLHNHDNTVWKSLKFLKTMLNTAMKIGGLIDKNPMDTYECGSYKQGIPLYLEWSEVQSLHNAVKTKATGTLQLIGYYTLLSYYSGLRFSDAISFNYSKKVIEDTSGRRLLLHTQKTGEIVSIKFNKYITEVVEFIKDKPLKITNQEFNEALKRLAGRADIIKDISSHTARHSFAMRCAELNMSIDEVQKLLGHNKRSSTEVYFKIKNKRLDEAMDKWE
jgi:integrase/recombinase XerD